MLSALNQTISDYVERTSEQENTITNQTVPTTQTPNYYLGQEKVNPKSDLTRWLVIAFAVAASLALVGSVIHLIYRNKHDRRRN